MVCTACNRQYVQHVIKRVVRSDRLVQTGDHTQLLILWATKITPQDETWTDFDGPSWIQYDLFRKNKLPGIQKGKSGQVYASSQDYYVILLLLNGDLFWEYSISFLLSSHSLSLSFCMGNASIKNITSISHTTWWKNSYMYKTLPSVL